MGCKTGRNEGKGKACAHPPAFIPLLTEVGGDRGSLGHCYWQPRQNIWALSSEGESVSKEQGRHWQREHPEPSSGLYMPIPPTYAYIPYTHIVIHTHTHIYMHIYTYSKAYIHMQIKWKQNYQEAEKYTFNEYKTKLFNIGLKMAQMLESTGKCIRIKTKTIFYMFKKWWCGRYKIFKLHFRNENSNTLGRSSGIIDTPEKNK